MRIFGAEGALRAGAEGARCGAARRGADGRGAGVRPRPRPRLTGGCRRAAQRLPGVGKRGAPLWLEFLALCLAAVLPRCVFYAFTYTLSGLRSHNLVVL